MISKKLFQNLKTFYSTKKIKRNVMLKKLRFDSIFRRIIVEFFNEFSIIMKKIMNFAMNDQKIKNKKNTKCCKMLLSNEQTLFID